MQATQKANFRRFIMGRRPIWTFARIGVIVAIALLLFMFVLVPVRISGNSMEPTCYDGQISVLNRLSYEFRSPKRGDIIGFRLNKDGPLITKRIIGLPGERIAFHCGTVFINGGKLNEPYLAEAGAWEWPEETLDGTTYFVSGDNRTVSQQFRVGKDKILGKIYNCRF